MKSIKWNLYFNPKGGYIPVSRTFLYQLLNMKVEHIQESLYMYLMLHAAFHATHVNGVHLKRGEVYLDALQLMNILKLKKTKLYEHLKELINDGLIQKLDARKPIYRIIHYEEHCGKLITESSRKSYKMRLKEEETSAADTSFEDFYDFYHYALDIPPVEKVKARREWNKLTPDEREAAMQHITDYGESIRRKEHTKQACNYLRDKTFLTYVEP